MGERWYFTFGCGQLLAGHYICLHGSHAGTRAAIIRQFGTCWSNQYSEAEWNQDGISQAERWNYKEIEVDRYQSGPWDDTTIGAQANG